MLWSRLQKLGSVGRPEPQVFYYYYYYYYYYYFNLALAQVNQLFALMEDNFPIFHVGKCIQDRISL